MGATDAELAAGRPWADVAAYVRGARGCTDAAALGAHTIEHLRAVTGAEWSECVQVGPHSAVTVLATSDADLTHELMQARSATAEPPSPATMVDETVSIEDLAASSPWPAFAAEASAGTGVRSAVLSYFSTAAGAGAVTVIDPRPAYFDAAAPTQVRLVADLFAVLLDRLEATARADQTEQAVVSGRVIGAACGLLAARRAISVDEGFSLLVKASQHSHRKVRHLAEQVLVEGDLVL